MTLPKFTQEEKENLNSSLSIKKPRSQSENCSTKETPYPDSFIGEFYQLFDLKMKNINSIQTVPENKGAENTSQFLL